MAYLPNGQGVWGVDFNPHPSTLLHVDINSCFATIEQQANPLLRGRPIVVAAYATSSGCILAASIEAKRLGIKTGMRVKDGRLLCPHLQVLIPDPDKYRHVHLQLKKILLSFSNSVVPKSIDEFVVNLAGYPAFDQGPFLVSNEIKTLIKKQIGSWLTVSIGIGPNRFLAKLASELKKPDGLEEINRSTYEAIYSRLKLTDLPGIKKANAARLQTVGVNNVLDFFRSDIYQLRSAFHSITGYYWYLRLHGWEVDDIPAVRRSFGNMYALPQPLSSFVDLAPILQKLVTKCSFRLRRAGLSARGVAIVVVYRNRTFWHHGHLGSEPLFAASDIYQKAFQILTSSPQPQPVANLAVYCFHLVKNSAVQLDLFTDVNRKINLSTAVDTINCRWGEFTLSSASMLPAKNLIPDRISFGGVRELDDKISSLLAPPS